MTDVTDLFDCEMSNAAFVAAAHSSAFDELAAWELPQVSGWAFARGIPLRKLPAVLHASYNRLVDDAKIVGIDGSAYLEDQHPPMPVIQFVQVVADLSRMLRCDVYVDDEVASCVRRVYWWPLSRHDAESLAAVELSPHGIWIDPEVGHSKFGERLIGYATTHGLGWFCASFMDRGLLLQAAQAQDAKRVKQQVKGLQTGSRLVEPKAGSPSIH